MNDIMTCSFLAEHFIGVISCSAHFCATLERRGAYFADWLIFDG